MTTVAPCTSIAHRPVDMWSTTNVISYCARQNDDYQKLPQRKIMPALFAADLRVVMRNKNVFEAKLNYNLLIKRKF